MEIKDSEYHPPPDKIGGKDRQGKEKDVQSLFPHLHPSFPLSFVSGFIQELFVFMLSNLLLSLFDDTPHFRSFPDATTRLLPRVNRLHHPLRAIFLG
jgi:hypothetical protein